MTNWGPTEVQTRDKLGMTVTKTLVNENFWIANKLTHPQSYDSLHHTLEGRKKQGGSRQKSIDLMGGLGGGSVIVCHVTWNTANF
jgi:hypothetical protein